MGRSLAAAATTVASKAGPHLRQNAVPGRGQGPSLPWGPQWPGSLPVTSCHSVGDSMANNYFAVIANDCNTIQWSPGLQIYAVHTTHWCIVCIFSAQLAATRWLLAPNAPAGSYSVVGHQMTDSVSAALLRLSDASGIIPQCNIHDSCGTAAAPMALDVPQCD